MFESFHVFETVREHGTRSEIQSSCLARRGRILSLGTFFEDTKLLSPSSDAMRLLISGEYLRSSVKELLQKCFENPDSGSGCLQRRSYGFEHSYRRLWLLTWQHFPEISSNQIALRKGRAPSRFQKCATTEARFGALSKCLGFDSPHISKLEASPSRTPAVEQFLQSFIQGQSYKDADMKAAVQAIELVLNTFLRTTRPLQREAPVLTQNRTPLRD